MFYKQKKFSAQSQFDWGEWNTHDLVCRYLYRERDSCFSSGHYHYPARLLLIVSLLSYLGMVVVVVVVVVLVVVVVVVLVLVLVVVVVGITEICLLGIFWKNHVWKDDLYGLAEVLYY